MEGRAGVLKGLEVGLAERGGAVEGAEEGNGGIAG